MRAVEAGSPRLDVRVMSEAEVALAVEWAAAEGWNPGLCDAEAFRAADPDGFLMAFLDGQPTAAISVVAYGETHGFLGFFIVRPELRGRGIGFSLWQAGMARLAGRSVGLDGVVDQQANYARSGFVFRHRNVRYEGPVPRAVEAPDDTRPVTQDDFERLAHFDAARFGTERPQFLAAWLAAPGHVARIVERPDGASAGYGVIRPCRVGFKIGPLFAETPEIASSLFDALVRSVPPDEAVVLDVPEPNGAAVALAETRGLAPVFETARMVRGAAPSLPLDEIFGVTSFELG
ncbi:GNAT family N-acetyltransferase [Jiella avicenniae]|uniref:GNAT family N-acetyltransferase n=1 Tax=Jiella avicenniae TaxID=2907202 RepID=A0A9X1P664_9HYPH|nr:GNAT family N-acetyltransferase [Jiella avicenniae]MCE7029901.1 GNAT family N-acetyltransferase [Jiella avicenniae]